jgi:ABC-type enterochelin transport system permease subunit
MAHMAFRGVVTAVAGISGYEVLQLLRTTKEAASEIVAETGMAVRSVLADVITTFATVADALQSLVQVKTGTLARLIAKTGHLLEQALMIAVPIAAALGCAALMPHVQKI